MSVGGLWVWTSEIDVPSFKWCSRDDWLQRTPLSQFASMVLVTLWTLSAKASDIALPMVPVETSTHLVQRFLFGKVPADYALVAQPESFGHVSSRE